MPLITLQNVDYSVGGPLLLENVELSIDPGERIALIGRNGAGKSTLLRLLTGAIKPDDGEIRREGGVRIGWLEQEVPHGAAGDGVAVVPAGRGGWGGGARGWRRPTCCCWTSPRTTSTSRRSTGSRSSSSRRGRAHWCSSPM